MIEVLWHGRGGQGAFTAARLLGAAASMMPGGHGLAFPSFGPERRGAPMRAFTKIADAQIGDRSAITVADYVVYLDETLFAPGWEKELNPGGCVLVNSREDFGDPRVISLDASGISREVLGREIPNTVFLGALSQLCEGFGPDQAKQAVRDYMAPKLHESNIRIIDQALEALEVALAEAKTSDAVAGALGADSKMQNAEEPASSGMLARTASATALAQADERGEAFGGLVSLENAPLPARTPDRIMPALCDDILDPQVYARTTCYAAGHLVSKNAGWRTVRPVIDAEKCTGCLQCYLDCPDGTIYKTAAGASAVVAVDYDFCKGCGVCARGCRFGAIAMCPEGGAA